MDVSDGCFVFLAIGDLRPRLLDAVLSDFSISFNFFPFLLPNKPPKIPFFFFFVSTFSGGAGTDVRTDFLDFVEEGVGAGSSTS